MNNDTTTYFFISFLVFLLGIFITREIFSIPRIVKHLRAQTFLLASIAEKLGVDPNRTRKAYFEAEGQSYKPIQTDKSTEDNKIE
jgi:hypothetical protein